MKIIGYTRCSTNEQSDSGLGLDAQASCIGSYCELRGAELVTLITDAGVSGGKPLASREGGRQLLDMLRRKQADAVAVLKLDRLFRNAADCLGTVEKWDRAGVSLHILDLGGNAIDSKSAAGRFMLTVLAATAEMERNLTRERTKSAMAVKRTNGQRIGEIPFGSDLADDGRTLVSNTAERAIIDDMKVMRERGWTYEAIAEELTEMRVATKKRRTSRWAYQVVAAILKRETS